MSDLRTAALAAYEEQQAVERERLAERNASIERVARRTFVKIFGIEPDSMETAGNVTLVSAGGLVLRYSGEGRFYMWETCPRCHQLDTGQYYVDSLELLGKALVEDFTPNDMHRCPADYEQPEGAATDATGEYLDNSIGLADLATGHEGPATSQDAAALGQLYALIAIAAELRRANDRAERLDARVDNRISPGRRLDWNL